MSNIVMIPNAGSAFRAAQTCAPTSAGFGQGRGTGLPFGMTDLAGKAGRARLVAEHVFATPAYAASVTGPHAWRPPLT